MNQESLKCSDFEIEKFQLFNPSSSWFFVFLYIYFYCNCIPLSSSLNTYSLILWSYESCKLLFCSKKLWEKWLLKVKRLVRIRRRWINNEENKDKDEDEESQISWDAMRRKLASYSKVSQFFMCILSSSSSPSKICPLLYTQPVHFCQRELIYS